MPHRALPASDIPSRDALVAGIAATLEALRAKAPRIHAITSPVAQGLTANGLLALGAVPSLTVNPGEIADFVAAADALLLNLGMLDAPRLEALPLAAKAAGRAGKPVVLDPVFAERSASRQALARRLLAETPALLKLNLREAAVFADDLPAGAAVIVTGPVDHIRQGAREIRLANGHPLLARVTATGCLNGAILAACRAVEPDAFAAAVAGVSLLNIAAEIAAAGAEGPGSFAVRLIDALAAIDAGTLDRHLILESPPR